jgi:hypothetical protein
MAINFCFDYMSSPRRLGYPNLAPLGLQGHEFDDRWPRTVPLRLLVYFDRANIITESFTVQDAPLGSWYPVALAWHDFHCDYISLMSSTVLSRVRNREIRILFYYHEGDNPAKIKQRIDTLCVEHGMPQDCYLFISANTAAAALENFEYFPDHEHFFRYINRRQFIPEIGIETRSHEFTVLNRTHKWWRASCMADLHQSGVLDRSLWSYNTQCTIDDREEDNPFELDSVPGWRGAVKDFVSQGPYFCDSDDDQSHNDHRHVPINLYQDSYCHLVIETLFDADQSDGAFLTEKTYKAIKFGQPFVIIGTAHSLRTLREQGYKTFDNVIDNSYDEITDNTQRWSAIRNTVLKIQSQDMHLWFLRCLPDIRHNQKIFSDAHGASLNKIQRKLSCPIS